MNALHHKDEGNAPQDQEDPYYKLTDVKAKKAKTSIASQRGLHALAEKQMLTGEVRPGSILDWKSSACDRVCRSTFAADTMACSTATETSDFIVRFLDSLLSGRLVQKKTKFPVRFLSDCRSFCMTTSPETESREFLHVKGLL